MSHVVCLLAVKSVISNKTMTEYFLRKANFDADFRQSSLAFMNPTAVTNINII